MPTIETHFVGTCKDNCLLVVVSPPLHIIILLLSFSLLVSGCCRGIFSPTLLTNMSAINDTRHNICREKSHQKL
jgi:hypothetical protein